MEAMTATSKIVIDAIGVFAVTAALLSQAFQRLHETRMEKAMMRLAPTRPID
jgi:hypothetical protein